MKGDPLGGDDVFGATPAAFAAATVAFVAAASPSPLTNAACTAPTNPCALSCMLLFCKIAAREPYAAAAWRAPRRKPRRSGGFSPPSASPSGYSSAMARLRAAAARRCSRHSMIPLRGSNVAIPSIPRGFISRINSFITRRNAS